MEDGLVTNLAVALPPILAGQYTPETQERVEQFYFSVAAIFETWVKRRRSRHTRRVYREDVMAFVRFMGITVSGRNNAPRTRPRRSKILETVGMMNRPVDYAKAERHSSRSRPLCGPLSVGHSTIRLFGFEVAEGRAGS